jgi:hypothetical protein
MNTDLASWIVDWDELIDVYAGVLGREAVTVLDYDREVQNHGTILTALWSACGLPETLRPNHSAQWLNSSQPRLNKQQPVIAGPERSGMSMLTTIFGAWGFKLDQCRSTTFIGNLGHLKTLIALSPRVSLYMQCFWRRFTIVKTATSSSGASGKHLTHMIKMLK